jgi:hypothetical protein
MWQYMDTKSEFYKMTTMLNKARKTLEIWDHPVEEIVVTDNFFSYSRGPFLVTLTNSLDAVSATIDYRNAFDKGTTVCNIFDVSECFTLDGYFLDVTLVNGASKIFIAKETLNQMIETEAPKHRLKTSLVEKFMELKNMDEIFFADI